MIRITAALLTLACGAACAQTLRFEVATVKKAEATTGPGDIPRNMETSPGHFAMFNVPLRFAIEWAYDLKDYQVAGPEWIKASDRFDIVARAADAPPESQMRQMLQTLLVERFQMKVHRESRELPAYVLLAGKGESKLKEVTGDETATISGATPDAVEFHAQPISRFTFMLTRRMGRPVLDQTGLKGRYDWKIDLTGLGFNGREPEGPGGPSIFSTVQRDMGLRLESRKEPIDTLVIDSVSKTPTAN
jgi:uncharacterized protein (TIGR03435 family)